MVQAHQPLLGRLASRWFNEVIVTDALRLLLDDSTARAAFLAHVGAAASVDLATVSAFERERRIGGGRLDLEGVDPNGQPLLIIEAKIGHAITTGQITRYRDHQLAQLGSGVCGVLLLLVPQTRMGQASGVVDFVKTSMPEGPGVPGQARQIACLAMSWESCLDAIAIALPEEPGHASTSVAADVAQLRSACETLGGWAVPINRVPNQQRAAYASELLRQLKTRRPEWRWGAVISNDRDFSVYSYFDVPGQPAALAVGETPVFAAGETSEIWFRVHKITPDFAEVRRRLRRSEYGPILREHRGHVWVPVDNATDLGGPELVDSVADQLTDIARVVAPDSEPEPEPEPERSGDRPRHPA